MPWPFGSDTCPGWSWAESSSGASALPRRVVSLTQSPSADVGHGGRFAAARVKDDEGAVGVLLNLLEDVAGAGEAMGLPGILADEDGDFAMFEITVNAGPHHLALHPAFSSFFLHKCVGPVDDTEGLERATRHALPALWTPVRAPAWCASVVVTVSSARNSGRRCRQNGDDRTPVGRKSESRAL